MADRTHWKDILARFQDRVASGEAARKFFDDAKAGKIKTNLFQIMAKFEGSRGLELKYSKQSAGYAGNWIDKYYRIRSIKKLLSQMAFIGRDFDVANKQLNNSGVLDFNYLLPNLFIDENGIIHKDDDPNMELLLGLDERRIRNCKTCRNFFWAKRDDKVCCGKKCADTYNQKPVRERKKLAAFQYNEAARRKRKSQVQN